MRGFFYFSRRVRVKLLIVVGLFCVVVFETFIEHDRSAGRDINIDSLFANECDTFLKNLYKYDFAKTVKKKVVYSRFLFDPNTADSSELVSLGLSSYASSNIVKYRKGGGVFFDEDDFAKIYGIDTATFNALLPYINIDTLAIAKRYTSYYSKMKTENLYPKKFQSDTVIELNTSDSTLLMKIPGIGRGFAYRILTYRSKLGGYHSKSQLKEIEGVNDSVYSSWEKWLCVDSCLVKPLLINQASLTKLYRHPYINFYQARVIKELCREYGYVEGWDQFCLLEEFAESDFERLRPYVDFENEKYGKEE